jgi:hypothetical protein
MGDGRWVKSWFPFVTFSEIDTTPQTNNLPRSDPDFANPLARVHNGSLNDDLPSASRLSPSPPSPLSYSQKADPKIARRTILYR